MGREEEREIVIGGEMKRRREKNGCEGEKERGRKGKKGERGKRRKGERERGIGTGYSFKDTDRARNSGKYRYK